MLRKLLLLLVLAHQASANAGPACMPGFAKFLGEFERRQIDRAKHTRFPLRYSMPDRDDPELKQKTLWLDQREAGKFLSFPAPKDQRRLGLERAIEKDKAGRCTVRFNVPDSDMYAVTFAFASWKKNSSWQLVETEDHSL